jgi:hypothetical protein
MKLRGVISFRTNSQSRDAERKLPGRRIDDVLEVGKDALRRLGAEVSEVIVVGDGAYGRPEHEVERPGFGEVGTAAFLAFAVLELVEPPAALAVLAVDHRVGESRLVLDPERAVIVDSLQASVDLGAGKYETAPLAKRHERIHRFCGHGDPPSRHSVYGKYFKAKLSANQTLSRRK